MRDRWVIVANPAAGRGGAGRVAELAARHLGDAGVRTEVCLTAASGHAAELAASAAAGGAAGLVVCGGDGTVAEVLPAAMDSGLPLGLLPVGRGNDLARALGLPRRPLQGIDNLVTGRPAPIDVAVVNGHPFTTVSSMGLDADVSQAVNDRRLPLPGSAAYLIAAVQCLRRMRPIRVRLTGDFGQLEDEVLLVAAANTTSYGGGLRIAPQADPRDGLLDLCVVRAVSPRQVIAVLPRLFWGGHLGHPAVTLLRSRRVDIEVLDGDERALWADGEYATHSPATVEVKPAALRVILPVA